MGLEKTGDKLDAIHKWAHGNEKNIVSVLAGVISPFVKDEAKRQFVEEFKKVASKKALEELEALESSGKADPKAEEPKQEEKKDEEKRKRHTYTQNRLG